MNTRAIRTENDYKAALREAAAYFDSEPALGTDDAHRFKSLIALIEAFEAENHPIEGPST